MRTRTPTRLLWAPSAGRVDITVSATRDPGCMLAAWLVDTEHLAPEHAGGVCAFEIDAEGIGPDGTLARCGLKAHGDPGLVTDRPRCGSRSTPRRRTPGRRSWGRGQTVIGCGGVVLRRISQTPDYPLFLMLHLFQVDPSVGSRPKSATLHHVRGWAG